MERESVNDGEDFEPCTICRAPYDQDCEYGCDCASCEEDETRYSACCGARLNSDIEGFCPQCAELC